MGIKEAVQYEHIFLHFSWYYARALDMHIESYPGLIFEDWTQSSLQYLTSSIINGKKTFLDMTWMTAIRLPKAEV